MKATGVFPAILLIGLAACVSTPPPAATPTPIATLIPTAAAPASATVAATASPPIATPAFTPTPTTVPLRLFDGLRPQRVSAPTPQRGAPCGVVDFFDFPLGAPEGAGAQARWSFGRYSERYSGIHAGEDWVYNGGSLGQPVYSIGHGTVIYAQPLGWGVDQGTLIVRHVFADGHTILSFYGHLEPASVVLRPGACVERGAVVGRIGKPRGSPHLHFEIRTIYPDRPGPGYWSVDPRLAGWKPPSEYIWDARISTSPGVKWTRPFTTATSLLVGLLISDTLAAVDHDRLFALDVETGQTQWSRPLSGTVRQAVSDDTGRAIYLTTISQTLQAVDANGALLWQRPFSATTRSVLLPYPGGGLIAHDGSALIGLSAQGNQLWRYENLPPPIDWLRDDGDVIFATGDPRPGVYRLTRAGDINLIAALSGRLAAEPDHLLVYDNTTLYRLSDAAAPQLVKKYDRAVYGAVQVLPTVKGDLLQAQRSLNGVRLSALRPDGSPRWERALQRLTVAAPHLVAVEGGVYALTEEGDVWWIDQRQGEAQQVLDGTRLLTLPGPAQAVATGNGTLIFDARGGRLVALDPSQALVTETVDDWLPRRRGGFDDF